MLSKYLENKKVTVKPIIRASWLKPGHDGEFMYSGTFATLVLPIDPTTKRYLKVFDDEKEQVFFENQLSLEAGALGVVRNKNSYWGSEFKIKLDKNDRELDLSDPFDMLTYKVMRLIPQFANSWKERYDNPEHKWAITDPNEAIEERIEKFDKKKEAYKFLGKIEDDRDAMIDLLKQMGKNPSKDSKVKFLQAELDKLIDYPDTLNEIVKLSKDDSYSTRVLITDAVAAKALIKDELSYRLGSMTGEKLGETLQETIDFLKDAKHEAILVKIETQVKAYKKQ